MLNRERVVASLSLLILIFGIYQILDSRLASPLSPISTAMPETARPLPQLEPRLYFEDLGGSQNPFRPASDWMAYTPEDLPPPAPEPSRWLVMPLSKGGDPSETGYVFLREPPPEVKSAEPAEGTPSAVP